jgi:hypothetical protein
MRKCGDFGVPGVASSNLKAPIDEKMELMTTIQHREPEYGKRVPL